MIVPNFNLFLWFLFVAIIVEAVCRIILGLVGEEKSQRFGVIDVLSGIFWLFVIAIVFLT